MNHAGRSSLFCIEMYDGVVEKRFTMDGRVSSISQKTGNPMMSEQSYNILDELLTEEAKQRLEVITVEVRASLRIAEVLHQIMEEEGLNSQNMAAIMGMTPGYVSRLLAGDENPSLHRMARLLHSLGRTYV